MRRQVNLAGSPFKQPDVQRKYTPFSKMKKATGVKYGDALKDKELSEAERQRIEEEIKAEILRERNKKLLIVAIVSTVVLCSMIAVLSWIDFGFGAPEKVAVPTEITKRETTPTGKNSFKKQAWINTLLVEEVNYKNDMKNGLASYWLPTGEIKEIAKYRNDTLVDYMSYHTNGKTKTFYSIDESDNSIYVKNYFEDGTLESEGTGILTGNGYDYEKTGEWAYYDPVAKL